jgi:aspartate aminotransferase-like enzyme
MERAGNDKSQGAGVCQVLNNVTVTLKKYFKQIRIITLTASGTGGLEAAVVNMLSPGDKVLAVSIGVFGDRFGTIARTYGAEVIPLNFEWGKAADPEAVRKALNDNPAVKAVLVTHNETSTGVTNDMAAISKVVKEVDAVSSMSSINFPVDEWGCDVVVSGSQKGWMVPPGLAMLAVSEKAWKANAESKMPRFYFDIAKAKSNLEKGQTPWTPAISVVFAMEKALQMMLEEGIENIFARHIRIADMTRKGIKELGLPLFADEKYASNTVTSILAPEGLDVKLLTKTMREQHDIVLGGGQLHLAGKIFRIGHLGYVTEDDIKEVLNKLKVVLPQAGFEVKK